MTIRFAPSSKKTRRSPGVLVSSRRSRVSRQARIGMIVGVVIFRGTSLGNGMIVQSAIVAALLLAVGQAGARIENHDSIGANERTPSDERCETTLFLPDLRFLTNSVTVTYELSETLGKMRLPANP